VDLRWLLLDADGVMQRVRDGWLDELTAHGGERGEEFVLAVFAAEVACLTGDDFRAAMQKVARRFEIDSPLEMITKSQYWIDVDPTMIGAVRALRKLGVRCGLATNQQNLRGSYMRHSLGFGEVFDEQFYSHELGVAKPDAGYFRAVLERIQVPAETVLFLDDRDENVEGARAAGLPAELFPRDGGAVALRAILHRRGVSL
jgi:putative hydrolase of the HAD superfamily